MATEQREAYHFQLLVTSDVHGQIMPFDYATQEGRQDSLSSLASIIRMERKASPELLLLDNGDALQGTPLAHYAARIAKGGQHPIIAAMNELGYDAAVFGNHEFNYGRKLLDRVMRESDFPWLSAGIVDRTTDEPAFGKPYIIKRVNGGAIKIAVLGVTTHYIPNWENPEHIEGLRFNDALETVKLWSGRIREEEEPDLLVVAYHGGFERSLADGTEAERQTGENQGYAMCEAAKEAGIDVLITGHQHRLIAEEVHGVTVLQPGFGGEALGKVTISFHYVNGRWNIREKGAELLTPYEWGNADEQVLAVVNEAEQLTQQWLDEPIGTVDGDMRMSVSAGSDISFDLGALACRLNDHPFISFVHRAQLEISGAELSVAAHLAEQPLGFGAQVTMRDVLANFRYPNTLTVLRLSGRDIRGALERTADYFRLNEGGRPMVNPAYLEPKPQHYNYDMWAGIEYVLDIRRPVGERVVKLARNGVSIADDDCFDVVMNNYRASGGGDYEMFRGRPVVREIMVEQAELFADYFRRCGTVRAECSNSWKVIY